MGHRRRPMPSTGHLFQPRRPCDACEIRVFLRERCGHLRTSGLARKIRESIVADVRIAHYRTVGGNLRDPVTEPLSARAQAARGVVSAGAASASAGARTSSRASASAVVRVSLRRIPLPARTTTSSTSSTTTPTKPAKRGWRILRRRVGSGCKAHSGCACRGCSGAGSRTTKTIAEATNRLHPISDRTQLGPQPPHVHVDRAHVQPLRDLRVYVLGPFEQLTPALRPSLAFDEGLEMTEFSGG